jgi:hypothetical protein
MSIRFRFNDNSSVFKNSMDGTASQVSRAVAASTRQAAKMIEDQGRADISSAGGFGSKWTGGLHADVVPSSGALLNGVITVRHDIPFFSVFETGASIRGNPFLWLPLSFGGAPKISDYGGGLFRVNRDGKAPLLLDIDTKEPKYVGLEAVNIPKKFHIGDIIKKVMSQMTEIVKQNMRRG